MVEPSVQSLSVRIPVDLLSKAKGLAKSKKLSLNRYLLLLLQNAAIEAEKRELRVAFEAIAKEDQDIEWAMAAQAEVVLADPE